MHIRIHTLVPGSMHQGQQDEFTKTVSLYNHSVIIRRMKIMDLCLCARFYVYVVREVLCWMWYRKLRYIEICNIELPRYHIEIPKYHIEVLIYHIERVLPLYPLAFP